MSHPALIAEKANDLAQRPMLVVDKEGIIGDSLIRELTADGIVIYVSKLQPLIKEKEEENIVHVPFLKKIPTIPDNNYSYIFIVDDSAVLREAMSSFLQKAETDKSTLVFITNAFNVSRKLLLEIKDRYRNIKIIIYGDLFDREVINKNTSFVNTLLYQAKKYGRMELPGDGTKLLYPIYKKDLIKGILEATFGSQKTENTFCFFPKNGITYLSFAHLLQKNNPWLKIDFIKDKQKNNFQLQVEEGNYSISKNNSIESNIKEINFQEDSVLQEERLIKKDKRQKSPESKKRFPLTTTILLIILLLLLPLISTASLVFLGTVLLKEAKNNFSNGNMNLALNQAKVSQKTFTLASYSIKPLEYELSLIGKKDINQRLMDVVETGKNISSAAVAFFSASNNFSKVILGKAKKPEEEFSNGVNLVKNAIALMQKEINKNTKLEDFDKKIDKSLNLVSTTIDLWPTLAGFDGKQTYLVLLQNNMELRPGGGFIGSYGLLTVEKGRIVGFDINDVYTADGQLKAHVEPAFPIRRYLAVKHLFLRDSNFDLDFRNVASQAAMLFNLETGQRINGVIGVDLSFVKNLLNAIGEVEIVDYKEKVNSQNLFYVTESHVEKGFFPGSTQKKDFLRSLYTAIINKFSQEKNIPYASLLSEATKAVEEKHLLFGFGNPGIQNLFTVNGWSSAIWDERKNDQNTINDFLGINEANFSGNKVNYFVSRSVSQRINIDKNGLIKEEASILYKNDSTGEWPGGDYKNYLRIILPQDVALEKITIDDKEQKIVGPIEDPNSYERSDFTPPNGLEVKVNEESGKTVYGFLITVPKGKLVKISIFYSLPQRVNTLASSFSYSLKIFKQPGIDSFPYDLIVSQPNGYRVLDKSSEVITQKDKEVVSKDIVKDETIIMTLAKE